MPRIPEDKPRVTNFVRYELPYPPSTNGLFFNRAHGGRGKTAGYEAWQIAAGLAINRQGCRRIRGAYSLSIGVMKPDKRRRDLDNLIKAVNDLIVKMGIVDDDCHVQRIEAEWTFGGAPCVVIVQEATEALAA